jgi:hypothetical protein
MSTRELHAERDRLAAPLAECPPDRSRELRLAAQRATEAERARQQARTDHQAASQQVAALAGSWRRRRELPAAKERRVLAEHTVATTTGQADQAAERLGVLRRVQQRHLGWMEAHDTPSCGSRSARAHPGAWLAWQGRPAGAGAGPAGLVAGRTRPRAHRPAGAWGVARGRRGTGRLPAHLRPGPPRAGRACWGQGGPGWSGGCTAHGPDRRACRRNRRAAGAPRPWRAHPSPRRPRAAADHGRPWAPGRPAAAAGRRTRRQAPGRRRDWQVARAALEHLAAGTATATSGIPTANDPAAPSAATSASRNATAARAPWFPGSLTL